MKYEPFFQQNSIVLCHTFVNLMQQKKEKRERILPVTPSYKLQSGTDRQKHHGIYTF